MIVKNIDSSVKLSAEVWQALEKRVTFLGEPLEKIPIYLVSADTMLGIRLATYLDTLPGAGLSLTQL
ncbi:MAG: hypothetical protein KatS3mg026_1262 [Bacteroidia bacterium]|nr:MAG: hypothetical protein KatS3mg026_1262 [Bacteroidia bacterium]